jgi:hypothetical protein
MLSHFFLFFSSGFLRECFSSLRTLGGWPSFGSFVSAPNWPTFAFGRWPSVIGFWHRSGSRNGSLVSSLRDSVPEFLALPRTYVRGYPMPPLQGSGSLVMPTQAKIGLDWGTRLPNNLLDRTSFCDYIDVFQRTFGSSWAGFFDVSAPWGAKPRKSSILDVLWCIYLGEL